MPSTIINFNGGVPAVEEQYNVEQGIINKFSGTTNAGKFILSFNENPEYKTTVEMLRPENLHQQYDFIAEESSRKIMLAHRITSQLLLGIKTATGFSSNADELKVSYEIFYSMVINPKDPAFGWVANLADAELKKLAEKSASKKKAPAKKKKSSGGGTPADHL